MANKIINAESLVSDAINPLVRIAENNKGSRIAIREKVSDMTCGKVNWHRQQVSLWLRLDPSKRKPPTIGCFFLLTNAIASLYPVDFKAEGLKVMD